MLEDQVHAGMIVRYYVPLRTWVWRSFYEDVKYIYGLQAATPFVILLCGLF